VGRLRVSSSNVIARWRSDVGYFFFVSLVGAPFFGVGFSVFK